MDWNGMDSKQFTPMTTSVSSHAKDDKEDDEAAATAAAAAAVAVAGEPPLTYGVSQQLICRGMGWMYFLAFYGAYRQNEGLMGRNGLLPSRDWFESVQKRYHCPTTVSFWDNIVSTRWMDLNCVRGFVDFPSVVWWLDGSDATLHALLLVGTTLSFMCGLGRGNSVAIWLMLWILYFSIVTSAGGTSFYNYGWESQLLETGFLCAFLCQNWIWPSQPPSQSPSQQSHANPLIVWLFRWLSFRISIGAGMIKIRGDSCWTQKTCLWYHFETQPLPSPLSFGFHFLPKWLLKRAVDLDLFVQVYTSWFVLLPHRNSTIARVLLRLGGTIQVGFMVNIALSGNMSMLNHLTILPALACLDDACYPRWLAKALLPETKRGGSNTKNPRNHNHNNYDYQWRWSSPRVWADIVLWAGILYLSVPVVENLLELGGTHQKMNASFGSFRLVNSYGAFGSVGKARYEPIVSVAYETKGTDDPKRNEHPQQQRELEWIELEFPCKPGSLDRRPCFCAPYHYRLDWNIWFIGFKPHAHYLNRRETWLYHLLAKILTPHEPTKTDDEHNDTTGTNRNWWAKPHGRRDRPWLDLLDGTSSELLERKGVPVYAKVDMYRYEMAAPLWELLPQYLSMSGTTTVQWWKRYYEESLLPVVALDPQRGQLVRAEL